MKALVIGELSRRGGGPHQFVEIAEALKSFGYDIHTLSDAKYPGGMVRDEDQTILRYGYSENLSLVATARKVQKLNRQINALDLKGFDVSVNNHPNIFLYNATINILHGFSFLDPFIGNSGELESRLVPGLITLSRVYSIYDGSTFVANSKYTRDLSEKLFKEIKVRPGRMHVVYGSTGAFPEMWGRKKRQILAFGRINRKKNLEVAIDAARMTGENLVIAGAVNSGDEPYLKELRSKAGDSVKFVINPSDEAKKELYRESSTLLHTKRNEHFGLSVADALAFGTVPVVPKSGGPWIDIVEKGEYGFGYDSDEEMVQGIKESFEVSTEYRHRLLDSFARFSQERFRESMRDVISTTVDEGLPSVNE